MASSVALMRELFDEAGGNYGVPRMYKALRKAGIVVNRKKVRRLMRRHGMGGRRRRRRCRSKNRHAASHPAITSAVVCDTVNHTNM